MKCGYKRGNPHILLLAYTGAIAPVCMHFLVMNNSMLIGDNSVMFLN